MSFLSLANKYGWESLEFMVQTGAGDNNIFKQVYKINILDMHAQVFGYFGLQSIRINRRRCYNF